MARRKRSISRTIKSTKALVNVVNIDTKVVEERTYELPYALDDEKEILAEIERIYTDEPNIKPVYVISATIEENYYVASYEDFLKIATKVEKPVNDDDTEDYDD